MYEAPGLKQDIASGDGSQNVQAARDVNIHNHAPPPATQPLIQRPTNAQIAAFDPKTARIIAEARRGGRTANDVFYFIAIACMVLGMAFILGGLGLVGLGGTGTTTFMLFGNTLSSHNVGVASIFCGAVVVALTFRRVIRGAEKTIGR
jgi:hypothetical protein